MKMYNLFLQKNKGVFLLLFLLVVSIQLSAQEMIPKLDAKFNYLIKHKALLKTNKAFAENVPSPYKLDKKKINDRDTVEYYSCFIFTKKAGILKSKGINIQSILPNCVTALVSIEDIERMIAMEEVSFIEAPEMIQLHNDVAVASTGASLLHNGILNNTNYKGAGVLVGIYDSGIDWDHPDFRNETDQTKSRILRIWDQTLTTIGTETKPVGFTYGVEYTKAQIDDELDGSPANFVREADINGHGTHVAGTAAGNGMALASRKHMGMAPNADIIIVKGGNGSFSTANTVDAFTYFQNVATELNKPIVVNMSIGGQFGAHDGTRPQEIAADNFTSSANGRMVVISAGNDNGSALHRQAVVAPGTSATFSLTVAANTTATDLFAFRLYANDNTNVTAVATAPGGGTVAANVNQAISGNVLSSSFAINLTNSIDVSNNDRYVEYYVTRNGTNATSSAGTWSVAVTNNGTSNITLDGWLYYSNSAVTTTVTSGDNNYLVASPGNASSAITAAAYLARLAWFSNNTSTSGGYNLTSSNQDNISSFSAVGPRRDGVQKPDIAAHGQVVISCLASGTLAATSSDNIDGTYYRTNQGTSMASPVTAGAVALLLEAKPTATVTQIKSAIRDNAMVDGQTGSVPNNSWGYGKLDVYKAMQALIECALPNRKTYQYEGNYTTASDGNVALTTNRVAVRYSPDVNGKLGGVYFHTVSNVGAGGTFLVSGSLTIEVRSNNSGNPGTLLGSTTITPSTISKFSWNYYDLNSLNISITSGTDYFVILYAGTGSTWGIRRDNTSIDNRSFLSTDGGTTWTPQSTLDYRIRTVVYETDPVITGVATNSGGSVTKTINGSPVNFVNDCGIIAKVAPIGGATAISGSSTAKIWIDATQNAQFVKRHIELTPASNATTATGTITMYFTQQEFDDFNALNTNKLPTSSADAAGIARLLIEKRPGQSSNNTGNPVTYTGTPLTINPPDANITWNSTYSRWEVKTDVTGFSGFFVKTITGTLALQWLACNGSINNNGQATITWKVIENAIANYEVERSNDGITFTSIGNIRSIGNGEHYYTHIDNILVQGYAYYRIKQVDTYGRFSYSTIVKLVYNQNSFVSLYPNPVQDKLIINASSNLVNTQIQITDAVGRVVIRERLQANNTFVNVNNLSKGVYYVRFSNGIAQKIVKQ